MNGQVTCATCRWWLSAPTDDAFGICKRMPPTAFPDPLLSGRRWPTTVFDDWCGEHTPIDSDGRLNKWGFKTPTEGT